MKLTYDMELQDYLYMSNFDTFTRKRNSFFGIIIVITVLFIGIDFIRAHTGGIPFEISRITVGAIASILIYFVFLALSIRSKVNKIVESSPDVLGTVLLEMTEESITQRSKLGEGSWKWEGFLEFVESKTHFMLYITIASALVIPKRSLTSEKQIHEVRGLLKGKADEFHIKYSTY